MCCKRHNRNTGEDDIDAAYKGGIEMGIYYNPEDLEKFASIGEESPNWQKSFLITIIQCLKRELLPPGRNH